jgi:hypothetical protein
MLGIGLQTGHTVSDHFVAMTEMVEIGSGAQRDLEVSANCYCRFALNRLSSSRARRIYKSKAQPSHGCDSLQR